MRTIKFRGKLISDDFRTRYKNGWIYGGYIKNDISHFIISEFDEGSDNSGYPSIDITFWQKVIPETVGQFTGLYDKNGKEIYEGDIVDDSETELIYVIEFICGEFVGINEECGIGRIMNSLSEDGEVIGNIHDNPELIEREGN